MATEQLPTLPTDTTPRGWDTPLPEEVIAATLTEIAARLLPAQSPLGFPAAGDGDLRELAEIVTLRLANNLGLPNTDGAYPQHTKDLEWEAIGWLAGLLRAPAGDIAGHVTSGATIGMLYGLDLADRIRPNAMVMCSAATHPAVRNDIRLLKLPHIVLRVDEHGELDYQDLHAQVDRHRSQPITVVANAGTTFNESVDDVRRIHAVLDACAVPADRRFVVVDAAFSGIPLALLPPADRPGFDLADGADVVVISLHKFLGLTTPGAAAITRASLIAQAPPVCYSGSPHDTIEFSRNGHAALALWYRLAKLGKQGLTRRADEARALAHYLHTGLEQIGWPAARYRHAMTVTMAAPPLAIRERHHLTLHHDGLHSRAVCTPGTPRTQLDQLLAALTHIQHPQPGEPSAAAGPVEASAAGTTNGRGVLSKLRSRPTAAVAAPIGEGRMP